MTEWFAHYDVFNVQHELLLKVRAELLAIKGVGMAIVDSI
jgi:endonuclease III-like uncharacterized protein